MEHGDADGRGGGVELEDREDSDEDEELSDRVGERVADDGCSALCGVSDSAPCDPFSNVCSCDLGGVVD